VISVTAALPDSAVVAAAVRAPFVLVHGAANSASVWTYWQRELAALGVASYAIDLRGHGKSDPIDLSRTSMQDYADDVTALVRQLASPPVLMGWSMGGLAAMMCAESGAARAFIGLAPSTPTLERNPAKQIRKGEYGADYYGITDLDPDAVQPSMPDLDGEERAIALGSLCRESVYARGERAAGVVVRALRCPALIVTGTGDRQWPRSRYDGLHLPVEHLSVDDASHWGLVLSRRVIVGLAPRVVAWLDAGAATEH
jgi:pimeloyl-ACP methyl ester carboxylesterase